MITKMKKLTFLVYHKEYEVFLERIRELGVVHVVDKQWGEMDETLQAFLQKRNLYKTMLQEMYSRAEKQPDNAVHTNLKADALIKEYDSLQSRIQDLNQQIPLLEKDIAQMQIWGDFDWNVIGKLKDAGWTMQFYTCLDKEFDEEWAEQYNALVVQNVNGRIYFVTVTPEPIEMDVETVRLPALNLSALESKKAQTEAELTQAKADLKDFCKANYSTLNHYYLQLDDDIDLLKVKLNSEQMAEGAVVLLEGWVPEDNEQKIKALLDDSGVYYEMKDAAKDDPAPIKLKNNAFSRMYEVITNMYGMPDYAEFDPTPLLAPFFTLFFAFCVGDAGYGLVLLILGLYLKKKLGPSMAGMMNLVMTLGAATTVLGAIFGTFFGVNLLEVDLPWLEEAKSFMLSSDKLMYLALAIGVVHILVAMTVKAISSTVRFGFLESLSEWGWWFCVVGFVATGGLMYLKHITPDMANWAFIVIGGIAAIGIFLFNNIHRNVFINIGAGVWDTYNMATGLVGDVLSYIRLYALGLAGAMLGMVFNQLAFMINIQIEAVPILGSVLTWIFCGLILIFGHTLNIAMCCLSAFVHPLRLTFVEYFKNSGYNGKGKAYKPFKVMNNNNK